MKEIEELIKHLDEMKRIEERMRELIRRIMHKPPP